MHKQTIHKGVRYGCNQCGYRFSEQKIVNHHTQTIHEGLVYECEQCHKNVNMKE